MNPSSPAYLIAAALFSALIAFALTPAIRALAIRIGAVDVPRDSRRMHKKPIPRMGGLAVFLGFFLTSLLFAQISDTLMAIWLGGLIIVCMGVLDDVFGLHPIVKFLIQIAAALTVIAQGLTIEFIRLGSYYVIFDQAAIPITVLWIVGLTNAMNLIDGLDGLSGGIAAISSASLAVVMFLQGDLSSALLTAALCGACLGFLPFNRYPARIFLGDTGSQVLGFLLSVLTLSGLFKTHAVISFFVPILIFALPIFDTSFAFFRRLFHGKNPFKGDRGHLHHRLIDLGHSQKETVAVLHAICGILSVTAVIYTYKTDLSFLYAVAICAVLLLLYLFFLHPKKQGMEDFMPEEEKADETAPTAPDPAIWEKSEAMEREQDTASFRYMMSEEQELIPPPITAPSTAPEKEAKKAPVLFEEVWEDEADVVIPDPILPDSHTVSEPMPVQKASDDTELQDATETEEAEENTLSSFFDAFDAQPQVADAEVPHDVPMPAEEQAPQTVTAAPSVPEESADHAADEAADEASPLSPALDAEDDLAEFFAPPPTVAPHPASPAVPHRMEQVKEAPAPDGYLSVEEGAAAPSRRHPRPSRKPRGLGK